MKKELAYFKIDQAYGGNQSWFRDPMMKLGGCGAATACDSCIYLALHGNRQHLYPNDIHQLSKDSYIQFAMRMKLFLRPRMQGINTLELFVNGFDAYLKQTNEKKLRLEPLSGDLPYEQAKEAVRKQIDLDLPIPFLLLRHKNYAMRDFVWHWFLVIGYEEFEDNFQIKVATYGNYHWLSLKELWNTGYKDKGGMILLTEERL